jgi:thiamine pyrophosphate-dependent acetolactate synthase large subunit-like protein
VTAVYGRPLAGVEVVEVPLALIEVFVEAHQRVVNEPAGAHVGDGRVHGGERRRHDPGPPAAGVVDAVDAAARPVVLAGPGVVRWHAVDGLRALAERASCGVLNTWGAKGVFDWRSPHHLATVGLQSRDFELGGLADADLIITTGLDEHELLGDWELAPTVDVLPSSLAIAADLIRPRDREILVPRLRRLLAAVTQAGWEQTDAPLPPTKITQHYGRVLGDGGLVAAEPGLAGYWVARTFATQQLGGVQVPARREHQGVAVACCVVARLADPGRPVLAVVDHVDDATARSLDTAERLGIRVPVEVWSDSGDALDADGHLARLHDLVRTGGQAAIATDPTQLDDMLAAAGPIVAWTR